MKRVTAPRGADPAAIPKGSRTKVALAKKGVFGSDFNPFRDLLSDAALDKIIGEWVGIPVTPAVAVENVDCRGPSLGQYPHPSYLQRGNCTVEMVLETGVWTEGNGSLDLTLQNGSKLPWFSTSLFLESEDSECLWVPRDVNPGNSLQQEVRSGGNMQEEKCRHNPYRRHPPNRKSGGPVLSPTPD